MMVATSTGCPAPKKDAPAETSSASEWVAYQTEVPITPAEFDALASTLIGADAQAGHFMAQKNVNGAFFVTSEQEPSTPDQVRLTFSLDDGTNTLRPIAVSPASYSIGKAFISIVDAAMAKMQADQPSQGETFELAYNVSSTQGGKLSLTVKGLDNVYMLSLKVTTPKTSLASTHVGQATNFADPTDSISGTVWFTMSKNEFDFFVDHAYGKGATGRQNFVDFHLVPYDWLRLSVKPRLDEGMVDVGFEAILKDGSRIPVAKAPASVNAGDTFHSIVDRLMKNTMEQEKTAAGSSAAWTAPFYYDHPEGGGVVQVIAQNTRGIFSVAYSVETPQHVLKDVPFVPYKQVNLPKPKPSDTAACYELGDPNIVQSLQGRFDITFTVSDVIKNNLANGQGLTGTIYCSVFHASDVTVTGPTCPIDVCEVHSFSIEAADLLSNTAITTLQPSLDQPTLAAGEYQVLCSQHINGSETSEKGNPVTLPIGGFQLACNKTPITVEFALLNPYD